jgi:hypothetical protein
MSSVPGPQAFTAAHRYAHPQPPPNAMLTPPSPLATPPRSRFRTALRYLHPRCPRTLAHLLPSLAPAPFLLPRHHLPLLFRRLPLPPFPGLGRRNARAPRRPHLRASQQALRQVAVPALPEQLAQLVHPARPLAPEGHRDPRRVRAQPVRVGSGHAQEELEDVARGCCGVSQIRSACGCALMLHLLRTVRSCKMAPWEPGRRSRFVSPTLERHDARVTGKSAVPLWFCRWLCPLLLSGEQQPSCPDLQTGQLRRAHIPPLSPPAPPP